MAEWTGFLGWVLTRCCCWRCFGVMEGELNFGKGMKEQGNVPETEFMALLEESSQGDVLVIEVDPVEALQR